MTGAENIPEEIPEDAVICYPPNLCDCAAKYARDGSPGCAECIIEGTVVPDPLRNSWAVLSADHWPAFQREHDDVVVEGEVVEVDIAPRLPQSWHDEARRLEERGRLDSGGCECDSCRDDKYSGEDYY